LNYLKTLVEKLGVDLREDTTISEQAKQLRMSGEYLS
jgi:hypothetical protein